MGVRLDHSLDPMTVVSHGAAFLASTLEKSSASASAARAARRHRESWRSNWRMSATERRGSPVAGIIKPEAGVHEVKIDSAGGLWSSGWLAVIGGAFQVDVMLHPTKPVTNFSITAHNRKGNAMRVTPAEFSIAYMLPMAAPPLPHTVAIELSTTHGVTTFDPVFQRSCPLPAEAERVTRRTARSVPAKSNRRCRSNSGKSRSAPIRRKSGGRDAFTSGRKRSSGRSLKGRRSS